MATIPELFAAVDAAEQLTQRESIIDVLKFFHDISSEYEPAIFILNLKINEGMFRIVFDYILHLLDESNTFAAFNLFGEDFMNQVVSVLTVDRNSSKIMFNPIHLSRGRYDNSFFTIEEVTVTENTPLVRSFIETNKFNFRSFINTVTKKLKFSYSIRRDTINNRKINPTLVSVGNDLFITEKVRDQDSPWLSTNRLVKFKILIDGEKCISGGRPGIPGSVYITLSDRTSIILFRKGTCLIVGSKMHQRKTLDGFVLKTFSNIQLLMSIFTRFSQSDEHTRVLQSLKIEKCDEADSIDHPSTGHQCEKCLIRTAALNELNVVHRLENIKVEYLRYYNALYRHVIEEQRFISSIISTLENPLSTQLGDVLSQLAEYCNANPNGILSMSRTSVFGLKKRSTIDAGLFIQMPDKHKKNVSLFTGNRITFRSLKNINHASAIIELYDNILHEVRSIKNTIGNVFQYTDEELMEVVDQYSNLFSQ